ncbi:MAG: hypothetical protein D6803_07900 [Anaerolineae bacterium]|nr:MAG: hypothetical protein D6803_07900 [Anaerolineae bacterium]
MIHRSVETVYVVPGAGDEDLLRYLAQSGVHLIGGETPPEDVRGSWVASFAFSSWEAFQQFWPRFAAGEDGQAVPVTLSLEDVNPGLLSPGRQRLVEEVMQNLLAGYIQTISESVP